MGGAGHARETCSPIGLSSGPPQLGLPTLCLRMRSGSLKSGSSISKPLLPQYLSGTHREAIHPHLKPHYSTSGSPLRPVSKLQHAAKLCVPHTEWRNFCMETDVTFTIAEMAIWLAWCPLHLSPRSSFRPQSSACLEHVCVMTVPPARSRGSICPLGAVPSGHSGCASAERRSATLPSGSGPVSALSPWPAPVLLPPQLRASEGGLLPGSRKTCREDAAPPT